MVYKGKIIDLNEKVVMAIVNITTDSFFDGGSYLTEQKLISRIESQLSDGATIIDLGACSTRPSAVHVDALQEEKQILWALNIIKERFPNIILSIDTYRRSVAEAALNIWGEIIVNDVSAGDADKDMIDFVASSSLPYISMHHTKTSAKEDITSMVVRFFHEKWEEAERKGIKDFIIDVGFGFGKTTEENFELVKNFERFKIFDKPLLVGISRKSMIYKTLNCTPTQALTGTIAINTLLLKSGANILRVHDSKEAAQTIKLVNQIM
ncbi:MAG: dihydropteroate synthase [Rikenellaceae bacterium]